MFHALSNVQRLDIGGAYGYYINSAEYGKIMESSSSLGRSPEKRFFRVKVKFNILPEVRL